MRPAALKVGELARRAGVSVRTIHHYDEIGLISPSLRTEAGHRLYTVDDVGRLQQVKSLRQLGLGLGEIRDCLSRPEFTLLRVIQLHITHLKEEIELERTLCGRLEAIAARLSSAAQVSVEELIKTLAVMSMIEKYYTPEQLKQLEARRRHLGEEAIRQAEVEWPKLIEQTRAEMEKGTDPTSEEVQLLTRRWKELVDAFTGDDLGIEKALRTMYEQEPGLRSQMGVDPKLFEYASKAIAALK